MSETTHPTPDLRGPVGRPPVATVSTVAAFLGVSERSVRSYVSRGLFPAYRVRGTRGLRFRLDEVERSLKLVPVARASVGLAYGPDAIVREWQPESEAE